MIANYKLQNYRLSAYKKQKIKTAPQRNCFYLLKYFTKLQFYSYLPKGDLGNKLKYQV